MAVDVFSAKQIDGEVRLDARRAAILIVDMLNEFCKPGGAMVLPGYEALVPPQRSVIDAGRQAGCPIVFVVDTHRAQRPPGPRVPEAHAALHRGHLGRAGDRRSRARGPTTSTSSSGAIRPSSTPISI